MRETVSVESKAQNNASEVVSETTVARDATADPNLEPPVSSENVTTTEVEKKETAVSKTNSKLDGLTFYDLKGKVTPLLNSLPKGLKLKMAKEEAMLSNIPELISTPIAVVAPVKEEVDMDDDQFQTVELKMPESHESETNDDVGLDSDMVDINLEKASKNQSLEFDNFINTIQQDKDLEEEQDDMEEIEPKPISKENYTRTYSFEDESVEDLSSNIPYAGLNSRKEEVEKKREVVPIYELCEAIDTQRVKTKEAEEKASRLSKDFQNYKEKSQIEIDESYREVKEAGDSQTEAESRYKIAEQEHQTALQNLIDTGKSQQRILKERQKDADDLIKQVVQERKKLEQTNNTTLAQNQVQLQKYLNHTIDLNTRTQEKREQAAKWDAIAKAMQDPEEDLMGYINPNEVYEVEESEFSKSYRKAA